jgi:hypothetical protein
MVFCAMILGLVAAKGPEMVWQYAYEIDPSGIEIAQPGTYHVWVWVPDDAAVTVTLAGKELSPKATEEKKKHRYVWVKAGDAELKAGKAEARLAENIAAIALSTDEAFDPAHVMGDMRVLDTPDSVHDRRAETAKHTDTVFTMPEFSSRQEWEACAARLRKRMLIGCGLFPLPERTPLMAEITGRIAHDDYTVEKARIEARPGFLVTGNLYRPVGKGPFPGVANPHGHWKEGRLADEVLGSVPGRCITQARMGMVAFSYDMIGYNDSMQFEHRFGGPREKLWGISPFAMQLWSSIRAVDFLQSLPDVDPERIGCTGASGGGTQTFALTSVDSRVKVSAPVNMISHSMQGGCLCENAPLIRMDNSNMEIGALMAPRPLLMVSATGDWTRETPRVEYPAIKSIYALFGAQDELETIQIDAPHNYNKSSREAVYRFLGKWLLGDGERWAHYSEPPFTVEKQEDLRVFPDKTLPEGLPKKEEIIAQTIKSTREKWQAVLPKKKEDAAAFRKEYGDVLAVTLGTSIPAYNDLDPERVGYEERKDKGYVVERWVLHRRCVGGAVPALLYRSYGPEVQDTVLVVHGKGKAALADIQKGVPGPLVAGLMAQGKAVMAIDTFLIGEHQGPWKRTERKQVGDFMDTFQPTDTGYRVQDVLTSTSYLRSRRDLSGKIDVVGLEEGGLWCLLASAIDDKVGKTVVDGNRFDADDDEAWAQQYYIPCIRSIGDLETAAALIAPRRLVCFNAAPSLADGIHRRYSAVQADTANVSSGPMTADMILEALR